MGENTKIEWAHHTFNPWIGCTKVSPACDHCYAEAQNGFYGWNKDGWGPHAPRRRTSAANWQKPLKWNRDAGVRGIRERVFCASLADVFDNHKSILDEWRADLKAVILATPNLDWLLLTKRPQNIEKLWGLEFFEKVASGNVKNVWLGVSAENQEEWGRRVPVLKSIPAHVRFVSSEPLLSNIDCGDLTGIHQVIAGGENGASFRHSADDWYRALRDQCASQGVAFLLKQFGGRNRAAISAKGRALDGVVHDGYPTREAA